jgi:hypothetical protein
VLLWAADNKVSHFFYKHTEPFDVKKGVKQRKQQLTWLLDMSRSRSRFAYWHSVRGMVPEKRLLLA